MFVTLRRKCFQNLKIFWKDSPIFGMCNYKYGTFPKGVYITSEKNPGNHSKNDEGFFYTLPNSLSLDILFRNNALVEEFTNECRTFGETGFLIRKPGLDIINCIKSTDFQSPVNKYVLYGKFGSGKTITMAYVIHYAYLSEWLIVYWPNVKSWIFSSKEAFESPTEENLIHLPINASIWLLNFKILNENLIKKLDLKIENDYKWNIKEVNKKGESLLELVNFGINRTKYACDVITNLLGEIKSISKSGKVKTLVAIGSYNFIFEKKTRIKNFHKRIIEPTKVHGITAFKNMTLGDWHNGAVVLTLSPYKKTNSLDNFLPMNMMGVNGFEFLEPFIPIEVPPLTEKEMTSILAYYRYKKWLLRSEADVELKFLCAGNPYTLRRLCGPVY